MFKRVVWTGVGYGLGFGSSVYVQRKVKKAVEQAVEQAPDRVKQEVLDRGRDLAVRARAAGSEMAHVAREGRRAFNDPDGPNPPARKSGADRVGTVDAQYAADNAADLTVDLTDGERTGASGSARNRLRPLSRLVRPRRPVG